MPIPRHGLSSSEVLSTLNTYRRHDAPWREGKVLAGVYDPGEKTETVVKQAYMQFLTENALYSNYYPSLVRIENEIVRSLADLLQGDDEVVGNCTSGGTESILLAVKAARDKARAEHPEIIQPEIVLPRTAHAAFHKAAHYLDLKLVVTDFDPQNFRADLASLQAAITPNTILLVASAPCYSHGVVDPIPAIAELALSHQLPLHVDACVGGIHLAMMRKAGYEVPAFDFAVPGVTSLSVDMHKYGYAPKNVSVLLYRNRALRRYALYANAETTGYVVPNTTVLSSRTGGPLAAAWAALQSLGEEGYIAMVQKVMTATQRLIDGINALDDVRVLGRPDMCMFAITSDTLNIFVLDDEMTKRGWALQPQFHAAGSPANLHISMNHSTVPHVDTFLEDMRASIEAVKTQSSIDDVQALQAQVQQLMQQPGPDTFAQIIALAGLAPGTIPTSFARINTVLDTLPDEMVDILLVEYMNNLYA